MFPCRVGGALSARSRQYQGAAASMSTRGEALDQTCPRRDGDIRPDIPLRRAVAARGVRRRLMEVDGAASVPLLPHGRSDANGRGFVPEDRARSAKVERLETTFRIETSESELICGRGDSNPHALASASPSSWCVCQFRHFRVRGLIEKNRLFARLASSSAESARFRADVCALSGSTTLDTKRSANRKTSIRHKRTRRSRRLMHDLLRDGD